MYKKLAEILEYLLILVVILVSWSLDLFKWYSIIHTLFGIGPHGFFFGGD